MQACKQASFNELKIQKPNYKKPGKEKYKNSEENQGNKSGTQGIHQDRGTGTGAQETQERVQANQTKSEGTTQALKQAKLTRG